MDLDRIVEILVSMKAKYPAVSEENILKLMELWIRLKVGRE